MAIAAGHNAVVEISSSASSGYAAIQGLNSVSMSFTRELGDITEFADTARDKHPQLRTGTISMSGASHIETNGDLLLRTQFSSGSDLYVQVAWDGTSGHNVACLVERFSYSASVDGLIEWSADLVFNGEPDQTIH